MLFLRAWLSMVTALTVPVGPKNLRMRPTLALCRYHSPAFRELLWPSTFNHKVVANATDGTTQSWETVNTKPFLSTVLEVPHAEFTFPYDNMQRSPESDVPVTSVSSGSCPRSPPLPLPKNREPAILSLGQSRLEGMSLMSVKLYAFTCGTVTGEFARLMEGGEGDITVPVPVFLIEHPRGRALFDTGLHPDIQHDPAGRLGERLTQLF